jgi:hypothetical protein
MIRVEQKEPLPSEIAHNETVFLVRRVVIPLS